MHKKYFKYLKIIISITIVALLTSCGSDCYDDANVSSDGIAYHKKQYNTTLEAKYQGWFNTGVQLTSQSLFPITINSIDASGTVFLCNGSASKIKTTSTKISKPTEDGSCSTVGLTPLSGCSSNSRVLCEKYTPNSTCTPLVTQGNQKVQTCTNKQTSSTTTKTCDASGENCDNVQNSYILNTCTAIRTCDITGKNCTSSTPKCTTSTTNIPPSNYTTVDTCNTKIGESYTCNAACYKTSTQDLGNTNNVSACTPDAKDSTPIWVEIDSTGSYPGDILEFTVPPARSSASPTEYGTQPKGSKCSTAGNPSINRWAWIDYLRSYQYLSKSQQKNCPNLMPFSFNQSIYSSCVLMNNGYYTAPLTPCNSPSINESFDNFVKGTVYCAHYTVNKDNNSNLMYGWYVGGAGLVLKLVKDGSSCAESNDADTTYFNQGEQIPTDVGGSVSTSGDSILYVPTDPNNYGAACTSDSSSCLVGPGCSFKNPDKCTSRKTTRTISGPISPYTKICATVADTNNRDNLGGYQVLYTRKSCVAYNGLTSPAANVVGVQDLGALRYAISENIPTGDGSSITNLSSYSNSNGTLWLKIVDSDATGGYSNNTGHYDIKIKYQEATTLTQIGCLVSDIKNMIRQMTLSSMPAYFKQVSNNVDYINYIRILITLYIILYGIFFIIGYVEISQFDLLIRVMKIGLVLTLISDTSWDWFKNNFFEAFMCGIDDLIKYAQLFGDPNAPVFGFVDKVLGIMLFSKTTWLKIISMFAMSPLGSVLSILMILSMLFFLLAIFQAIVIYLVAIIVLSLLILLAPIFIPFVLFGLTKNLFDNWITKFIQFSLEPVMLLIGLNALVELLYIVFIEIVDFSVCWKCLWPINLQFASFVSSIESTFHLSETIFCLSFFGPFGMLPGGSGSAIFSLGVEISNILLFIILAMLIKGYDTIVQSMISMIIGSSKQSFRASEGATSQSFSSVGRASLSHLGYDKASQKVSKFSSTQTRNLIGRMMGRPPQKLKDKGTVEGGSSSRNNNPGGTV